MEKISPNATIRLKTAMHVLMELKDLDGNNAYKGNRTVIQLRSFENVSHRVLPHGTVHHEVGFLDGFYEIQLFDKCA